MHKLQEKQMKEYIEEIEKSNNKPETMHQILKREDRLLFKIIDTAFLVLILIGLVYGWMNGAYTKNEVTIDCNGIITKTNNPQLYPEGKVLLPNMTTTTQEATCKITKTC